MYEEQEVEERLPYQEGYEHGESGKSRHDNPYRQSGGGQWWDWDLGWVRGIIAWLKSIKNSL